MVCLLSYDPSNTHITGWIIAADLSDLFRQVQARQAFNATINQVTQPLYQLKDRFPAPTGRVDLPGGFVLLID